MKARLKLIVFLFFVICYVITNLPLFLWSKVSRYSARKLMAKVCQFYARAVLKLINVNVKVNGTLPKQNHLFVSNHLSYVDILALASVYPSSFVTSMEMKKAFFLGQICELGGCLYVERRSRENLSNEVKDIKIALEKGLSVTIFPEATSTNGDFVKRFKRPLFQAAIDGQKTVVPLTINYKKVNGHQVNVQNRDIVCWYDDMTFGGHFMTLLSQKSVELEITIGSSLMESDVTTFSESSHHIVRKNFKSLRPISYSPYEDQSPHCHLPLEA